MTNNLSWSGQAGFVEAELKDWTLPSSSSSSVGEVRSGQVKNFGKLTYMTVERAGHMVSFLFFYSFSRLQV